MITYEYKCTDCEYFWEIKQKITDPKITICPKCNKETAEKLISNNFGFILKGSGWFKTGGY